MKVKDDCSRWVKNTYYELSWKTSYMNIWLNRAKNGSVVYKLSVDSEVWARHANQLKTILITSNETRHGIHINILLDTFEIQTPGTDRSFSVQAKSDTTSLLPRRWTNRRHRPVTQSRVDTNTRSYKFAQRRDVSGIYTGLKYVSCRIVLGHTDWLYLIQSALMDTW